SNNLIGGTTPQAGNILAFNDHLGIYIDSGSGNTVQNNSIFSNGLLGIGTNGATVIRDNAIFSNGWNALHGATRGGVGAGPGSLTTITRNATYSNTGLGIEWLAYSESPTGGVTPNDPGESDGVQNHPDLT